MGLFSQPIGTVFLKESSDAEQYIARMKELSEKATGDLKDEIDQQIKLAELGLIGEKQIAFELKNSGLDMYVLHDIYLEIGDLSAQIDYLVFTKKLTFVIECKNLYGNITIDNKGNFIRKVQLGKFYRKEGIYSPVTQNERHLNVLYQIRMSEMTNPLMKAALKTLKNQYFYSHQSIIVLANPKTVVNDYDAPLSVKKQVVRADQLIKYIKAKLEEAKKEPSFSDKELEETAQHYLSLNKSGRSDYAKKYEEILKKIQEQDTGSSLKEENISKSPDEQIKSAEKHRTSPEPLNLEKTVKPNKDIDGAEKENKIVEKGYELGKCPRCGGQLIMRKGYSWFIGCSNYPKCRYTEKLRSKEEKEHHSDREEKGIKNE